MGRAGGVCRGLRGSYPPQRGKLGAQFHISHGVAGDSVPAVAEVRGDRWGRGCSDPRTSCWLTWAGPHDSAEWPAHAAQRIGLGPRRGNENWA
jgi:hypothetical protein